MILLNYELRDKLYESYHSIVYRARRKNDNQSVVIKILNEEYPLKEQLVRFNYEYELLKIFDSKKIIKAYEIEKYENSVAIVEEDFNGMSLNQIDLHSFSLSKVFELFIMIADIVDEIHKKNVIHKDISPSNILWNTQTNEVKMIDFGIATRLSCEKSEIVNSDTLEGKLAYISPEQTGRMNRTIDFRSDFYSLGATFYELLTGTQPFAYANDEMELVHCHLAKTPTPVHEVNNNIPVMISNIIQKLMSKNAEDRYQSIFGLKSDLQECLNQFSKNENIKEFELCKNDLLDKFQISQKLYGREKAIEKLMNNFNRVSNGNTELMLVSGSAGVGKSILINEIHKPLVQEKGYFISGKYDLIQKEIPYSAIINAFRDLIQQLLTESTEKVKTWKKKFLEVVGSNGQILIDAIPQFEVLIGKQNPVYDLPPTEAQNRFNLVFQNFISIVATKEHPLVIFLDDLQWADNASLKLIETLLKSQEEGYLLLIGSYRDDEVDNSHPLKLTINNIADQNILVSEINLEPLKVSEINQLLADSLNTTLEETAQLAELILTKTEGNPFFINEFLKLLYEKELVMFNKQSLNWYWDLKNIQEMGITDNVVELMSNKIKNLDIQSQEILKLSACIGNTFDLNTLSTIYGKNKTETMIDIWNVLQSYLVLPMDDSYKYFLDSEEVNPRYKFFHDRIQQAAYSIISDDEKKKLHLKIGNLMLNKLSNEQQTDYIFDIVSHLNLAKELIKDNNKKVQLIDFNLQAAKRAKNSTAYIPAFNYIKNALSLLKDTTCDEEQKLCLDLHLEGTEIAFLNGEFEYMEQLAKYVLENAETLSMKAEIYEIQIRMNISKNNLMAGIQEALKALSLLGIEIPENPSEADIGQGLMSTQALWAEKNIEDLLNLPKMTDPEKLAAMKIISTVMPITYVAAPMLVPMFGFAMVDLSVNFGNAPASTFGYATYGLVLCGSVGDLTSGHKFGELALNLLDQFPTEEFKARTYFYVYMFTSHWKQHLRNSLQPGIEAYRVGLETGDLANCSMSALMYGHHAYIAGEELSLIAEEMREYSNTMKKFNQDFVFHYNELYRYAVLSWLKDGKDGKAYFDEYYENLMPVLAETRNISAIWIIYLNKAIFNYVMENFTEAYKSVQEAEKYIMAASGAITQPLFYLYDSLIRLAIYSDSNEAEQKNILQKVEENQEKMNKWAENAPMNFLHKWKMIEAEKARITGKNEEAEKYYDEAIDLASKHEYINEEALAYELAARYFLEKNKKRVASCYLWEAHYAYQRWGALVKVKDMKNKHSKLFSKFAMKHTKSAITSIISKTTVASTLDLASVLKASQNISGEIELKELLNKLMKIIIENAGAQRGGLVLQQGENWFIEAIGEIKEVVETRTLTSIPLPDNKEFSENIIRYVIRTKESIVLTNASEEGIFTKDSYVMQNKPKSIICAPLIKQGKLIGIIYLENNITIGAFTEDRLQVLNLLSSQAAISVENSRIYENLEVLVQNRTEALNLKNMELEKITLELRVLNNQLEKLASEDPLTGLYNRRQFYSIGENLLQKAAEKKHSISILMLDIDYFKHYNDTYGHQEGDRCLVNISKIMKKKIGLRELDVVARYGGEEFICFLYNIEENKTLEIANELCMEIEKAEIPHSSSLVSDYVTSSIGITNILVDKEMELDDLIKVADAALYKAKERGRNKAVIQ